MREKDGDGLRDEFKWDKNACDLDLVMGVRGEVACREAPFYSSSRVSPLAAAGPRLLGCDQATCKALESRSRQRACYCRLILFNEAIACAAALPTGVSRSRRQHHDPVTIAPAADGPRP